jgi:hypothetical protein
MQKQEDSVKKVNKKSKGLLILEIYAYFFLLLAHLLMIIALVRSAEGNSIGGVLFFFLIWAVDAVIMTISRYRSRKGARK